MKYKDIPSEEIMQKLLATSFESPSHNMKIFLWADKVQKHIRFKENERVKLVQKYGEESAPGNFTVKQENINAFSKDFMEIMEMDVPEDIPDCPVKSEWFADGKCSYANDSSLWLNPKEIGILLAVSNS